MSRTMHDRVQRRLPVRSRYAYRMSGVRRFDATDEWRHIARGSDVLYSIASVPGKQGTWTAEDFYEHGASDWREFRRHWEQYQPDLGGTCVEIGCGAGRITGALAHSFERVIALDVSADMIERARARVPENVEFNRVDGPVLPVDDRSVDAVFSVQVMQHLEDRAALESYLEHVRRVLRPGGSMLIHIELQLDRPPSRLRLIRDEVSLLRSRRRLRRGEDHSTMRMRRYWPADVYSMLVALGFEAIELRMITPNEFGHMCWLATSP